MNEFVVHETKLTPGQVVMGTMGISLNELINAILENRDGRFDRLYKKDPPKSGERCDNTGDVHEQEQ